MRTNLWLYILKEIILSIFIRIRVRHRIFLIIVPWEVDFISSLPYHWGYNIFWGGSPHCGENLKYDFFFVQPLGYVF